ncbi:MAG: CoA transferase, partial [Hyphomicrobiales bacterium]|nr:CoA transferase [Hyphomicrobiales bacterium]
ELRNGEAAYAPAIIADKITGLHLAYAVLAALLHRERTGTPPGYVEIPMFESMVAFNLAEHLQGATWGDPTTKGYHRITARDRRPYRTSDGWLGVLPYTPANWTKVLRELGKGAVAEEAWFRDDTERSRRVGELYTILANALPARTTAQWCDVFSRLDVPHFPVKSLDDLLTDPHLAAVGFFEPNYAEPTPIKRSLRAPIMFDGLERGPDQPPPRLGADTAAILREAGLSESEIAAAIPAKTGG